MLLATPAVQLGVERANFDRLVSALICLSARLLASGRANEAVGGCLVLAVAPMLKLYTGLAGALAWMIAGLRRSSTLLAAAGSTALAIGVLGPETIAVLSRGAPEGATRFSTGAHRLFHNRSAAAGWTTGAVALLASVVGVWALKVVAQLGFVDWPRRTAAFNVAFLVAVPLFIHKDSYDYRLVLWLPCVALPLGWLRGGVDVRWRRFALATIALHFATAGIELPCALLVPWASVADGGWRGAVVSALVYAKQRRRGCSSPRCR